MYKYYQLKGGAEPWAVTNSATDISDKSPTFITVLNTSIILDRDSTSALKDSVKYRGPFYLDLDSEDLDEAIEDAQITATKLKAYGLQETDFQIFLSGKKGLHFIVPMTVFTDDKAVLNLPATYKELAYKVGTPSTDFRVYTGGMGRMFRTCYNQRENGAYKVQITLEELDSLTRDSYGILCSSKRSIQVPLTPVFRNEFALVYDACKQKFGTRKAVYKPPSAAAVQSARGTIESLLSNDSTAGFNQIALQLAIYAIAARWSEDLLVEQARVFLQDHEGGPRYGTPAKRERELRNLYRYCENNSSLEFSQAAINKLLPKIEVAEPNTPDNKLSIVMQDYSILQVTEDSTKTITTCGMHNGTILVSRGDVAIKLTEGAAPMSRSIMEELRIELKDSMTDLTVTIPIKSFNSASALHGELSKYGQAFLGNDVAARQLIGSIMSEIKRNGRLVYSTAREGLDWIQLIDHPDEAMREGFLVWADLDGVRFSPRVREAGVHIEFAPLDNETFESDLSKLTPTSTWMESPENRAEMRIFLNRLFESNLPETLAVSLGWLTACFYKQLIVKGFKQFPLMYLVGPAGLGKSRTMGLHLQLFYQFKSPKSVTPRATNFAMQALANASASIPLLLDEYKPHELTDDRAQAIRLLLRDSYDQRTAPRGGGSRSNSSLTSLSHITLTAPIVAISEAIESETAVLERIVLVNIRKAGPGMYGRYERNFNFCESKGGLLTRLGYGVVEQILDDSFSYDAFRGEFTKLLNESMTKYSSRDLDITHPDYKRRSKLKSRVIFNYTVAMFGIRKFFDVLHKYYGDEFDYTLEQFELNCFKSIWDLCEATTPEYLKALSDFAALTYIRDRPDLRMEHNYDYMIDSGEVTLNLTLILQRYRMYSKQVGVKPLYASLEAMTSSLKNCPEFLRMTDQTKNAEGVCVVLDLAALYTAGCLKFRT